MKTIKIYIVIICPFKQMQKKTKPRNIPIKLDSTHNFTYFIGYCLILFLRTLHPTNTQVMLPNRAKNFTLYIKYHFHPQKGHSKSVSPNTIIYGLYSFLFTNVHFLKTLVKEIKISVKGRKALL